MVGNYMTIEVEDVNSFIDLYEKSRKDGLLKENIIIKNDVQYIVYSIEQEEELSKIHCENAMHKMTTEFMIAVMKYPTDTFNIKIGGKIIYKESLGFVPGVQLTMSTCITVIKTGD